MPQVFHYPVLAALLWPRRSFWTLYLHLKTQTAGRLLSACFDFLWDDCSHISPRGAPSLMLRDYNISLSEPYQRRFERDLLTGFAWMQLLAEICAVSFSSFTLYIGAGNLLLSLAPVENLNSLLIENLISVSRSYFFLLILDMPILSWAHCVSEKTWSSESIWDFFRLLLVEIRATWFLVRLHPFYTWIMCLFPTLECITNSWLFIIFVKTAIIVALISFTVHLCLFTPDGD